MIQDRFRLSFPWIKIKNELEELLYKLAVAEDEEESALFLFQLYLTDQEDLNYFDLKDRQVVTGLLNLLIQDTRKHTQLVNELRDEIQEVMGVNCGT